MPKSYDARLATRITTSVDTRLRQLALLRRRRLCHLLDDVLDAALPSSEELAAQFARLTTTGAQPSPTPTSTPQSTATGLTPTAPADQPADR